ncbi:MAG: efflux RND transporter periplasmic adaptor subunit [Victivallales bacterium]|nr:efflux RND transporter periplasmic adaptor subunit [Victivallales bacterium]
MNTRTMRRLGGIAGALLLLLLLLLWQAGVFVADKIEPGREEQPRTDTRLDIAGRAVPVTELDVPAYYRTVGTVRSRDEIELSSRITARIIDIKYRSGDQVPKGELLIQLDDNDLQAAVSRNAERLAGAQANHKHSKQELDRSVQLFDKQVIPQKNLDLAERNERSARSEVAAAEQALKEAEANLAYAKIVSPMSAIVADRFADPGDMASPGKTLMSVFDPERLMLYVPIRESLVKKVAVGDKLKFKVEALDEALTGEIREIVPSVDQGSRTFLIKICIGKVPGLIPGMFGTLELELYREPAIVIPKNAIMRTGQLEFVILVKADGTRVQRLVRSVAGPTEQSRRIMAGLEKNEKIIIPGEIETQQ